MAGKKSNKKLAPAEVVKARMSRFDEICTFISLSDFPDDSDREQEPVFKLPNLLSGFEDRVLTMALISEAGKSGSDFANKLAMSIIDSVNGYTEDNLGDPDALINSLVVGATICSMYERKADAVKFLIQVLNADEHFEHVGIPNLVMAPISAIFTDGGKELKSALTKFSPMDIIKADTLDDVIK